MGMGLDIEVAADQMEELDAIRKEESTPVTCNQFGCWGRGNVKSPEYHGVCPKCNGKGRIRKDEL